jgi:hypothetical protein
MDEVTQFSVGSAQRIARVIRTTERTPAATGALDFDVAQSSPAKVAVRMGTFNGAWPLGGTAVVTLKNKPGTVSAINSIYQVLPRGTQECAVAKDGTAWWLVGVDEISWLYVDVDIDFPATGATNCQSVFGNRLSKAGFSKGINTSSITPGSGPAALFLGGGCVEWVQATEVSVVTGVSLSTAGLVATKLKVWAWKSSGAASSDTIEIYECPTTAEG